MGKWWEYRSQGDYTAQERHLKLALWIVAFIEHCGVPHKIITREIKAMFRRALDYKAENSGESQDQ